MTPDSTREHGHDSSRTAIAISTRSAKSNFPFPGAGAAPIPRVQASPTGINAVPLPPPVVLKRPAPESSEPATSIEAAPNVQRVGAMSDALSEIPGLGT